jgi:hypothetical protein
MAGNQAKIATSCCITGGATPSTAAKPNEEAKHFIAFRTAAANREVGALVISRFALTWRGSVHDGMRPASPQCDRTLPVPSPDKERSQERIDGITALVNALGRALLKDNNASPYEDVRCRFWRWTQHAE